MLNITSANTNDDLQAICEQMQPEAWGKDNEMTSYRPDKLKKYLESENTLLLLAKDGEKIVGAVLCYILPHPAGEDTLYVHEFDTHPDYRRQGIGTKMIHELQKIAKEKGLSEAWLATETDNIAANSFYKSLYPTETEPSVTYAYKIK